MVSLTRLPTFLLEMFLVETGIGEVVVFATGGRKSSEIAFRQMRVFHYEAEELSRQAAKVVMSIGSHSGANLSQGDMSRGSRAGSVGVVRCSIASVMCARQRLIAMSG